MDKLAMRTPDLASVNVEKIAGLFPHCVTEAHGADGELQRKIDWDLLRQELSSDLVQGAEERYRLDWPGKRQALYTGNMPINKTLRPCRGDSVDFDRSENLFIEGDNLDVLKLLRHTYMGKVKMIYIDPPYNTGKDFIYRDNYATSRAEYMRSSSQVDDAGNRLVANNESNGRFHSDWLSMMYPRLRLAQELLRDDGVIFISIDDNEQASLKRLCDEVFGEANFITSIPWQSRLSMQNDTDLSVNHEYLLVYAKKRRLENRRLKESNATFWHDKDSFVFKPLPLDKSKFSNPDNDPRGLWKADPLDAPNVRPNLTYPIRNPLTGEEHFPPNGRHWRMSADKLSSALKDGRIIFGKSGRGRPQIKSFYDEKKHFGSIDNSWFAGDKVGTTTAGTKEMQSLFDIATFDTPKPTSLLIKILKLSFVEESDIVLDFFSGSATTAHAVMQLNAEDGGNRKFIMVQLPEACDPKSEAYKAGYKTIADIGRERIRRAGAKILAGECHEGWNKDVGFRSLLVDSSNMNDAYYSPADTKQGQLDLWAREYIKSGRSGEDLLFQVLLDWGLGLTLPIERQQICGLEVFIVDDEQLVACFAQAGEIDDELFYQLAKRRPRRALFRSSGLTVDSTQTNAEQIFGLISPSTEIKIL